MESRDATICLACDGDAMSQICGSCDGCGISAWGRHPCESGSKMSCGSCGGSGAAPCSECIGSGERTAYCPQCDEDADVLFDHSSLGWCCKECSEQ